MGDLSNFIRLAAETVSRYNRSTAKPYQKIQHIIGKESELQVPSDDESYMFRLNDGWKITFQNKESIIIKRD